MRHFEHFMNLLTRPSGRDIVSRLEKGDSESSMAPYQALNKTERA